MTSDKVLPAEGFVPKRAGRPSPATVAVREAGPEYYTIKEVADVIGVHHITVRRLLRTDRVKAPSSVLPQGQNHIWLCNEDDLVEIGREMNARTRVRNHLSEKYDGKVPKRLLTLLDKENQ